MSFWCHRFDQNTNKNIVRISALKVFIASLGLPVGFFIMILLTKSPGSPSIWKKAISILVGNLNSGRSYFITAVLFHWLKLKPDRPDPTLLTYQPPYQGGRIEHAIPNEEFGMPTFYHQSDIFFDWTNAKRATTFIMRKIIATSKPWKEKGEETT